MASTDDYVGLITSEHRDKPKFAAMVALLTSGFVDLNNQLIGLIPKLNLDVATGDQLDIIGKWVGMPRTLPYPITNVYFSLDIVGVGFDQGSWQGPDDPSTGIVQMDDYTYRIAIKAKIGANVWDGSYSQFVTIMAFVLSGTGITANVKDNQDMTMLITLSAKPPALLKALLVSGFLPIKPAGVQQTFVIPA